MDELSVRAEKALRESVQTRWSNNEISSRIFRQMSRPERKLMYTQCNLTGNRNLFALRDNVDVLMGASMFCSWFEIKIKACQSNRIISELDDDTAMQKIKFMKWLREETVANSIGRESVPYTSEKQTSALVQTTNIDDCTDKFLILN
jgi:hypothetical protein